MSVTLEAWRRRFKDLDECPWAGPRPLQPSDPEAWLCGRDADRQAFRQEVDSKRVVFLAGSSGVGKTSLLQRGLIPELVAHGYVVAMCRDWSGTTFEHPASFLAEQVARSVRTQDPSLPQDVTVIRELAREHGKRAVIVLDQFEELIRDEPDFAQGLFDVLAQINRATDIKLVVSLRSEHLHELRPFEHQIQSYSTSHYFLDEVAEEHAHAIAATGNAVRAGAIEDGVSREVARLWRRARQAKDAQSRRGTPIGLLHLQALLYALHARTRGAPVTMDALAGLRRDLDASGTDTELARQLFSQVLGRAVEVKLDRCRRASEQMGLDRYLVEGTAVVLSNAVRHLSSAGFKLVRDAADLAEATIGTELDTLRNGLAASRCGRGDGPDGPRLDAQETALFRVVTEALKLDGPGSVEADGSSGVLDFLVASREDIAAHADASTPLGDDAARVTWSDRLKDGDVSPFDADPKEATQGPLMGASPTAVLIEEYRRFAFALEWMRTSVLCRVSPTSDGATRVALIHDGFGNALERWSDDQTRRPAHALFGLTAPRGAEYVWPTDDSTYRPDFDADADGAPRVLVNIRWRGASIVRTGFRQTVFASCDLRGTMFVGCRFEGVVFVNCLLDGVMFTDCTFVGEASPTPDEWQEEPTAFRVAGSGGVAARLASYRGSADRDSLVCANKPFFPATAVSGSSDVRVIERELGSVVVIGGRVSSLTVRGAVFTGGARLCLRETVGSGFDLVEHGRARAGLGAADAGPARVEITGTLLRHCTFSTSPHRAEEDAVPELQVEVHGSALLQAWFGDDLEGGLELTESIVLGLWNGSPPDQFVARARDACKYHGLVGVTVDDTCRPMCDGERLRDVAPFYDVSFDGRPLNLKPISIATDYRRDSSQEEAEAQRVERGA